MPKKKWEYKIEPITDDSLSNQERKLNKLGEEGWELVQIVHQKDVVTDDSWRSSANVCHFKREIRSNSEQTCD